MFHYFANYKIWKFILNFYYKCELLGTIVINDVSTSSAEENVPQLESTVTYRSCWSLPIVAWDVYK